MQSRKTSDSQAIEIVTWALARIRASDERCRSAMAQLRRKYSRLETLKGTMSQKELEQFEEIGELMRALEQPE